VVGLSPAQAFHVPPAGASRFLSALPVAHPLRYGLGCSSGFVGPPLKPVGSGAGVAAAAGAVVGADVGADVGA